MPKAEKKKKQQRMISLCPESHEIAAKMDNFSRWVREQLLALTRPQKRAYYDSYCPTCDTTQHGPESFCVNRYCTDYMVDLPRLDEVIN